MKNILKMCMNWKVLLGIGVAILLAYLFVPQVANYAWVLLVLACPLSMMLMSFKTLRVFSDPNGMAGMNHGENKTEKVFACTECGMSYKEVEWAKKCATWCKEHHSCNLEITKHAAGSEQQRTTVK